MLNKFRFIAVIFVPLFFYTCIDAIEFEKPDVLKNGISIQGKLTKGTPSTVNVRISNTFDFSKTQRLITAKSVELIDEAENILSLITKQQGIYKLDIPENHPIFKIEYGKSYKIKVQLVTGEIIESSYDQLNPVPEPTALNVNKFKQESFNTEGVLETADLLRFSISTPLLSNTNSKNSFFLWELESVFKQSDIYGGVCRDGSCVNNTGNSQTCFIHINPVRNYSVLDATKLSGDFIEDFLLLEETQENTLFAEGFYLTVYQQSLSEAAFDYWSKVNRVVNPSGSQFDSPAGRIPTNLSLESNSDKEILGYFFATESKLKRIYISPDYANYPRTLCPPPRGSHPLCCNCLCQPGATLNKPDWWVE